MEYIQYDVAVIGGGPAGLAAALAARGQGAGRVLLIERADTLGGILNQCIHNGFGLHYFKQELTGPEYAERFIQMLDGSGIEVCLGTTVLELSPDRTLHLVSPAGYQIISAGAVVLAMGCRERTRGAIGIPGTRPAGVFTAGAAQLYMNMEGMRIGSRAVILGSGDIGLIMARRLTLEGAKVLGVYELMPYSGGLTRNIVQCLEDYGIPLHLSHTITAIHGSRRVQGVTVQKVDENRNPIPGTEQKLECDTVLLSVGLIPENELSRAAGLAIDPRTNGPLVFENMETSLPGIFACGNVAHVHDLVDFVTAESQRAGQAAAGFAFGAPLPPNGSLEVLSSGAISYTVPQRIHSGVTHGIDIFFRVNRVMKNSVITASAQGLEPIHFKRPHLAPGEMEKITLPPSLLQRAAGTITISAKEAE